MHRGFPGRARRVELRSTRRAKATATVALGVLLRLVAPAHAEDIDTIRANIVEHYAAASADPADDAVSAALGAMEQAARLAQQSMTAQGSWSDIDYQEVPASGWSPQKHYQRLLLLAKAQATANQPLHDSAAVRGAVQQALAFSNTVVYDGAPTPGNWWHWRIGLPMYLGPTLLLVQGRIDAAVFDKARKALAFLIRAAPSGTGANLAWEARNHLYYAALTKDGARLAAVRDAMASLAVFADGEEGVMRDHSFHQHGAQLYTGGYGAAFAGDLSRYVLWTTGTGAALPADGESLVEGYVADGVRWSLYHNHFDPSVIGREITRASKNGGAGLTAMLQLANRSGARRDELVAAAKRMRAAELVNNEGRQSWHLSDGLLYLVLRGDEYFDRDVWPTLDWRRLPGTTVEGKARTAGEGYGVGTRSFVGGATDGRAGVAAMDFAANASELVAQKSWFFFDEVIVALGTEIRCPSGNGVETTIAQWPLSAADAPLVVDGASKPTTMGWKEELKGARWAHADEIGYCLFDGADLWAKRELRKGAWSALGTGSTQVHEQPILTLWLFHGQQPPGARYAYALLPRSTATQLQGWAAAPPVRVLAQTAALHAVEHLAQGTLAAVFWKPGEIGAVRASAPCALLYTARGSRFSIAAADPGHKATELVVEVAEPLTPAELPAGVTSVQQDRATTITFALDRGRSLHATFTRDDHPEPDGGVDGGWLEAGAWTDSPPRPGGDGALLVSGGCCSTAGGEGAMSAVLLGALLALLGWRRGR